MKLIVFDGHISKSKVFSFPKGPLMDCISRFDARGVTSFWERSVLSLGILCRPLSCCVWDQAQKLHDGSHLDPRIEYAAVVGKGGMSLPWNSLVDSGLCILSTREPTEKGFVAYKNYPAGWHEERLANKGHWFVVSNGFENRKHPEAPQNGKLNLEEIMW